MGRLIENLTPKKYDVIQWYTQAGSITNNINVKIDFTLPELSATKIMTWNCHVDESAKVRYYMILGRYISTPLRLNIKLSEHVIEANDLGTYEFKYLNTGKITPE